MKPQGVLKLDGIMGRRDGTYVQCVTKCVTTSNSYETAASLSGCQEMKKPPRSDQLEVKSSHGTAARSTGLPFPISKRYVKGTTVVA